MSQHQLLFDQLIPAIKLSPTLFHLGPDRWFEPFAKELKLFWGSASIEFYEDRLKTFDVKSQYSTPFCWYWESCLTLLQMVFTNAQESPRFFLRRALNLIHDKGATPSSCRLCWCKRQPVLPRKNKAAKGILLGPVAPAVSKWSLHC